MRCLLQLLLPVLIFAATGADMPCRVGDNPEASMAFDRSGHFLNTRFPAECDGVVTAWNYCFYPGSMNFLDRNYSATVALWRPTSDLYNIVEDSVTELLIQPVQTEVNFYCTQESLVSDNSVEIRCGDVVGVFLRRPLNIPMIGTLGNYTIFRDTAMQLSSVLSLSQNLIAQNHRIHLYADINATTTDRSLPEQEFSTTSGPDPPPVGLSGGAVAGIAVAIIALLIVGGVLVAVALAISWKKKTKKRPVSFTHTATSTHKGDSIDNLIYTTETSPTSATYKDAESSKGKAVESLTSSNIYSDVSPGIYESLRVAPIYGKLIEQNRDYDVYSGLDPYQEPAQHTELLYSQIQTHTHVVMDISRENIQLKRHLGSGQFGSVDEGVWKRGNESIPVALKTLKTGASERDRVKFLQEAATMVQFRHPNVVTMYGMVSEGEPILLVVELIEKGDLRNNLLKMQKNEKELRDPGLPMKMLEFSQHIALGMQYLSGKGFVHRDLAARNILLSKNNLCKIADFGLSRDLEDENYYMSSGGMVPVKWTAPEAIKFKKYSTASDVWSYGCLLYEIWSVGHKPFEKYQNMQILGVVEAGNRLAPPPGCPRQIYQLMIRCWHPKKSDRPTFRDIVLCLTEKDVKLMLEIPQSVLDTNPQFKTLGGSLEAGAQVYMDLKTSYS